MSSSRSPAAVKAGSELVSPRVRNFLKFYRCVFHVLPIFPSYNRLALQSDFSTSCIYPQLRRYRDEKGRGDAREGGELHNILFGNEEDNLTAPSSPFYSSSAEAVCG